MREIHICDAEQIFPPTIEELSRQDEEWRLRNEEQMALAATLSDPVLAHSLFMRTFEAEARRLEYKQHRIARGDHNGVDG